MLIFATLVVCVKLANALPQGRISTKFVKPSEETGRLVSEWNEKMEVNPEEMGEYFEGDILFPPRGKNGLIAFSAKWDGGIVPYIIKGPYSTKDLDVIYEAMAQYHKHTCIRFRRKQPEDTDYLLIQNTNTGCWSSVGKVGGPQELNLQSSGCLSTNGTPIHELMHAVGFYHEQNRYERDDYIEIFWKNIKTGREGNFEKVEKDKTTAYGVKYDYGSVMHYSEYAFSKNQQPTIIPKAAGTKIGQRNGFSAGDLEKIRKMYNCSDVNVNNNTAEQPSYTTSSSFLDGIGNIVNSIFG